MEQLLYFPELGGKTIWLNESYSRDHLLQKNKLLVYFWSMSCGYCKELIPLLNEMTKTNTQLLDILYVHIPLCEEDLDCLRIKEYAKHFQMVHPILLDNEHDLRTKIGSLYLPTLNIYDNTGAQNTQLVGYDSVKKWIKSYEENSKSKNEVTESTK